MSHVRIFVWSLVLSLCVLRSEVLGADDCKNYIATPDKIYCLPSYELQTPQIVPDVTEHELEQVKISDAVDEGTLLSTGTIHAVEKTPEDVDTNDATSDR